MNMSWTRWPSLASLRAQPWRTALLVLVTWFLVVTPLFVQQVSQTWRRGMQRAAEHPVIVPT